MNNRFEFFEKLNLPQQISEKQLFFVGGATREIICHNKLPRDIDICGDFCAEELSTLDLQNKQYIKKLHSLRFACGNHDIDLTAFRKEEYKKGYFPSKVERVSTAKADSERRDFTINAIYINKAGKILDFHDGEKHLFEKRIVQISSKTLEVDGMRILRMIRFSLTLGYQIDKDTLECAFENKENILQIKKERCLLEFKKFQPYVTSENEKTIKELGIFSHLGINRQ
ncbi:MAG: hypothetical protein R3Y65_02335 [Bacillota bacterium]